MTVDFQNHFWGDKQNGFDVLYQNLKSGSLAVKEFADLLRSRTFLEEYNANFLTKLSRKSNSPQLGTFQPIWNILKCSSEKLSSVHTQTLQRLNQLIKEINKYCDDHHRKQKQVKNEETSTIEAINELKETVNALNKAKEFYYSKNVEIDKLRRENASQKEIEKAEARVNKACLEFKNLIEKYTKAKEDFEKKFTISCQNFQKIEEDHIQQMKNYLTAFLDILESGHTLMGQVYKEFRNNCDVMSPAKLLEIFVLTKGTGENRPPVIQFGELNANNSLNLLNLSNLMQSNQSTNNKNNLSNNFTSMDMMNFDSSSITNSSIIEFDNKIDNVNQLLPKKEGEKFTDASDNDKSDAKSCSSTIESLENVSNQSKSSNKQKDHHKSFPDIASNTKTWFLRSRKDKTKDGKKKKKDSDEESNSGSISGFKEDFMVDSEGYTIRPTEPVNKEENFYSSSDTDSEEEKEMKIFVKINPMPKVSENNSVDQLIASANALTLAPSSQSTRRSNNSTSDQNVNSILRNESSNNINNNSFKSKENDLFDLFVNQNTNKTTTTPTTSQNISNVLNDPFSSISRGNSATKLTSVIEENKSTQPNISADRYAAFNELSANITANKNTTNSINNNNDINKNNSVTGLPFNVLPLPPKSSDSNLMMNNQNQGSSTLTKSISTTSFSGLNSYSMYKTLFKPQSSISSSNGMMSRAESIISLSSDFRMTPISLCSSRDSSPLTIGMSDIIPLALAFQESVSACFKGTDESLSKITIIGCIKIAFSAGIIQVLTSNPYLPQLKFKLKNTNNLEKIILSKELVELVESTKEWNIYEMNMNALQAFIKRLHDRTPNARYYNLDIIKYQVFSIHGAKNAPLQLVSHWKCDDNTTNLKINFKYNSSAFLNSAIQPLKNVIFSANIASDVISMNSEPFGKWDSLTKQATWKYNEISHTTDNSGLGSIKAKFDISNGPSCPSSVYVQFSCQDTILSGLDFELIGSGYRLSLIKRQFSTGRYYCESKVPPNRDIPPPPLAESSLSSTTTNPTTS